MSFSPFQEFSFDIQKLLSDVETIKKKHVPCLMSFVLSVMSYVLSMHVNAAFTRKDVIYTSHSITKAIYFELKMNHILLN